MPNNQDIVATNRNIDDFIQRYSMPSWEELPEQDLYMEQVTSLANQHLVGFANGNKSALTATMINNYVKAKIIPAPIKKKYNRDRVAMLLVLVTLKSLFNIQEVGELIHYTIEDHAIDETYEFYRTTLQNAFRCVANKQAPEINYQNDYKFIIIENVCAAIAYKMDTRYRLEERRQ